MSGKIFQRARSGKFFKRADLIVYAAVIIVVVVLLLVFLLPPKDALTEFEVTYRGARVLTYDFGGGLDISEEFASSVAVSQQDGGLSVTITTEDGQNTFFIDTVERSVKMTDADCSVSADCTYMPALTDSGGSIICVPNHLKILPIGGTTGVVTG